MKKIDSVDLYFKLREAYDSSTASWNRFKEAIDKIKWDKIFEADGETYFVLGRLSLTVENIDPFKAQWKPTIFTPDNSILEF